MTAILATTSLTNHWHDGMDHRQQPRFWTTDKLFKLSEYLERGWDDALIGQKFGCTAAAVQLARKRHAITARTRLHPSARDVARLLGIGCSKTVSTWIKRGWLRAVHMPLGYSGCYSIQHDFLLDFLDNPAHHHRWQPGRITDPALREWAAEIHSGPFLRTGEVARRLCVEQGTVHTWIKQGLLPAVRHDNWLVREADLAGFVPPGQRARGKVRHAYS